MKKLAILCALACALVACEKPMNENEEAKPEIKTVSFYSELRTRYSNPNFLSDFQKIIGSGEDEVAKDGRIYLVTPETFDIIIKQFPGAWNGSPIEENYFDNKDDLIAEFQSGILPAVSTIPATHGNLNNIPFGQYVLIGALGLYHKDTLKTYRGSFLHLTIDSSFVYDSIILKAFCSDTKNAFWQNTGHFDD